MSGFSLKGPFKIDRMEPPKEFLTLRRAVKPLPELKPGESVLAISSDHPTPGYVTVGYVSKQTPFGQGTFMGVPIKSLQRATREQVLAALQIDHPHGAGFRPVCKELQNAAFALLADRPDGPQGWTASKVAPGANPLMPVTTAEVRRYANVIGTKYQEILDNWDAITRQQAGAIMQQLK